MTEVSYSEETLTIGGDEVRVSHEIEDVVVLDGVVVVLLDPPADADDEEENIVAFDRRANRLWTVEPPSSGYRTPRTYTHIERESDELIANNWNGFRYTVDLHTGTVTKSGRHTK